MGIAGALCVRKGEGRGGRAGERAGEREVKEKGDSEWFVCIEARVALGNDYKPNIVQWCIVEESLLTMEDTSTA